MNESELLESMKAILAEKNEANKNLKAVLDMSESTLLTAKAEMTSLRSVLKDCVNELCLKCGSYHEAHKGACDGCRWKDTKDILYGRV